MNSNSKSVPITDPSTPIPGVDGWTYGDAVEEMLDLGIAIDLEIYPFAAGWQKGVDNWRGSESPNTSPILEEGDDDLPDGWTADALLDAAKCVQAEKHGIYRW